MLTSTHKDLIDACFASPDSLSPRAAIADFFLETDEPAADAFLKYYQLIAGKVKIEPSKQYFSFDDFKDKGTTFCRLFSAAICRLQPMGWDERFWVFLGEGDRRRVVLAEIGHYDTKFCKKILLGYPSAHPFCMASQWAARVALEEARGDEGKAVEAATFVANYAASPALGTEKELQNIYWSDCIKYRRTWYTHVDAMEWQNGLYLYLK